VNHSLLARWICDVLLGELKHRKRSISTVDPEGFALFIALVERGIITDYEGKKLLRQLLDQNIL